MSRIHDALKKAEMEQTGEAVERPAAPAEVSTFGDGVVFGSELTLSEVPSVDAALTPEDLWERTAVRSWDPDKGTMLFFQQGKVAAQETFRTLRSRLYQIRERLPIKTILIGSSIGKEGRSFVAANLAQVMVQQHGKRVLLIDGDLRGAKLHATLGAPSEPGMTDYLTGEHDEFAVMQRGPMENLFLIPAGKRVANPLELISNGRMGLLLRRIEPLFDWIIVDSSPAVAVSDPAVLASFCDAVLLVVRSNITPFDLAQKARDEFLGKKIIGVVLNGVHSELGFTAGGGLATVTADLRSKK